MRAKEGGKETVPCDSSPVTRVSRSPLRWEKRSAWGGGWAYSYIRRLRPKGVRTVPFSGFCNMKGSGFYSLKLRKALGLRYSLLFAVNTVSFILRLKEKYAVFLPGQWERGAIFNGRHTRDTFSDKDEIWGLILVWSVPGLGVCTCADHCLDGLLPGRINKQINTETLN